MDCIRQVLANGDLLIAPTSMAFALVMAGQMPIFGLIDDFSTSRGNSGAALADIAMKPLPFCPLVNLQHFDLYLIAFVRFLLLHSA